MFLAGRAVQALAHPLQQLAVAFGHRVLGRRALFQRGQGVGQQLGADAFAQHVLQRAVPAAVQQVLDGLQQLSLIHI